MENAMLNDLMTFVSIAEEKNFTRAAHRLGVTHSVVSKRMSRLESELKVRLINRTTRKLVLTEAGQALYERAAQIKRDIEEATLAVMNQHDRPYGKLRVNAPMSFGQLFLVPAVCDFMAQYPDIQVELILGRQYANLLEHSLDVSIQLSALQDSSFIARRLGERSVYICASPAYLEKHDTPKVLADLKQHNCLIYHSHYAHDEWKFVDDGESHVVKVQGDFHVNSSQAIKGAALKGQGIARLPSYLIEQEIQAKQLIPLFEPLCPRGIGIYAVYPHNRHLATKVRVFIDYLAERFRSKTY